MTVGRGYHCQWLGDRFASLTEALGVWRLDGITGGRLDAVSQRSWTWGRLLGGNDASLMLQRQPAVQSVQHHDSRIGIAAALPTRQQLQGVPLEFHRVVPSTTVADYRVK